MILLGYKFKPSDLSTMEKSVLTYHRIVESFKFSYAYRPYLGDPDHQKNKTEFMMVILVIPLVCQNITLSLCCIVSLRRHMCTLANIEVEICW